MPKEILLYTGIYSYSAAAFITELDANKGEDICVRGNCPGGDMFSTYGMIAKFQEHPKGKEIQVDGIAASAFAYMLCFADKVECLDVSTFLYHRAAYGSVEDEGQLDPQSRKILDNVNASIRAGMESKVSSEDFQKVTGFSYDQLFSMDGRLDVILNAQQMKQLGLVSKINTLTPEKKAEIVALSQTYNVAAFSQPIKEVINNKTMTKQEFRAANPEAYAEIVKEGVEAEKMRVGAWMVYNDVDPEAVKKGIEGGKDLDPVANAEFGRKMFTANRIEALKTDNPAAVTTPDAPTAQATADEKNLEKFNAEVQKLVKTNKY